MKIAFAPMEGLTGALYRQAHCRWFGGVDRYFIPFITPTQDHRFTKRELREILPEHNGGLTAVPQLLVRRAEDFLWAAGELAAMGYPEINLNLGCPSGTVVAKGKGSGFLGLPEELERFLDTVFDAAPCAVSIKTRLGLREPEEFGPLLALFQRYPLAELIVHPRVQKDMYKNTPRRAYFARALADSPFPVCYNGDLYTVPAPGPILPGRWRTAPSRCATMGISIPSRRWRPFRRSSRRRSGLCWAGDWRATPPWPGRPRAARRRAGRSCGPFTTRYMRATPGPSAAAATPCCG